ncbi:Hypothetical protein BN69_2063 [Methylocystis sp. SC2]|nr:Hypothetical protein BN69_2063 [Methylocystis sp. SC2]
MGGKVAGPQLLRAHASASWPAEPIGSELGGAPRYFFNDFWRLVARLVDAHASCRFSRSFADGGFDFFAVARARGRPANRFAAAPRYVPPNGDRRRERDRQVRSQPS